MPWGVAAAAIGAAGSLISGSNASDAASQAANAQVQAANAAAQVQQNMFNTTQTNLAPYMSAGNNSLQALLQQLGIGSGGTFNANNPLTTQFNPASLQSSPGYQFQFNQGVDAVQNSAAARGGVVGGNTLKALTNYGQGVANQDYWNQYNAYNQNQNRILNLLTNLAGSGQNAAANLGGIGATTAGNIGNSLIQAGNAQSAGIVGSASAGNNLISSLTSGISGSSLQNAFGSLFGSGGGDSSGVWV